MSRVILLLSILLILEAFLVWRPFETEAIAWQSRNDAGKVAGQMLSGFHLSQDVPAKLLTQPIPRKSISHWWRTQHKLHAHAPNCFAIRFATYRRQNNGKILVKYAQGSASQEWKVNVGELEDNYRRFCPEGSLQSDRKLRITIDGLSSKADQAATVWLSRTPLLKPASVNGKHFDNRSLNLRLVYFRHVGIRQIFDLEHGAFSLTCLLSLIIAMIALIAARKSPHALERIRSDRTRYNPIVSR